MNDISVEYDPSTRIRTWTYHGRVKHDTIIRCHTEVLTDPEYDESAHDLVDLTRVIDLEILPTTLMSLNDLSRSIDRSGSKRRVAIVATGDLLYGMASLYRMMRKEDSSENIEVFRSTPTAAHWIKTGSLLPPAS